MGCSEMSELCDIKGMPEGSLEVLVPLSGNLQ